MRKEICGLLVLAAVILSQLPGLAASHSDDEKYREAVIREKPYPGIRFSSGLALCDEELRNGRWLSRYWISSGQIKPEFHLESEREVMETLPIDAFSLGIEGQDLSGSWRWGKVEKSQIVNPAGLLVTFELSSKIRPITVKVHTLLHGGPVMIRWLEITNAGTKPTAITAVSPWSGLLWHTPNLGERIEKASDAVFDVGYTQYQDSGQEGAWAFQSVINESKIVSGTRGRSGWGHPTFFARNKATGEWFVGSLGWSGNWTLRLTSRQDQASKEAWLFFEMGPTAADPVLRVLSPGETVKTPETHLLCLKGDLDQVIQVLHDHMRHRVLPSPQGRQGVFSVEANHRGYIIDHETESGLKREIDIAAEVGAEMFVVDAGWFGPEPNHWWQNVGDWYAGAWLPNDLTSVREYARKKGLLFGLWVEIESIGAASRLRKEHPEWVLTRNGEMVADGRQLDVANPAVAAWMEAEVDRVIRKYDLDMFRLDYNTMIDSGGNRLKDGFVESTQWRHVENLYAMFDRLRKQFPRVAFQNCAAGGGRLDFGIMRRFDNTEITDWLRPPRVLKILNGLTWVLPPEILLRTFGTEVEDLAGDGNVATQLRAVQVGLPIFRGISPSLEELNPILGSKIRAAVDQYKREIRPILMGCRVYHHTPLTPLLESSPWLVLEYSSPDEQRGMVALFRTSDSGDSTYRFRPRGLDFSRNYRVTFGNTGRTVDISGDRLLQGDIPVRLEAAGTSELLLFESK